ncbi:protein BANP-like isoform 4-T8 [Salvelinus alpinus]
MSEQDLAEIVQIAVEDLGQGDQTDVLENHEDSDDKPDKKRPRVDNNTQDASLKTLLYSISQTICQRLDNMEAKLQLVEVTCRTLEKKLDAVVNKNQGPIQVPMVAGSPLGATQTWNKVRCAVGGRRQNTFLVKVPAPEDSQEEQESGSEASDSVSNSGQANNSQSTQNVTLITLNSEDDYPAGTWLGDENNAEMRVRCPVLPGDMLHLSTNCRTAEKMALTLLDYLFHREVQAMSNLSGQGKHGKKQLDPLMIYGIRCHLFYKFGITESDWYRIKQSIDSKCRTAWRRKQRGQSLAVKSFSRRSANAPGSSEGGAVAEVAHMEGVTQQTLHYTLANQAVQQVQIHRIGEDGQVQVIPQGHLHIAQVPQGEEVQITQDSEGNLQIHQVHVGQDGQVLRGAQLIAVASADGGATTVEGSPLQASDIQVQYVQLASVNEHTATVQVAELAPAMQGEMEVKEGSIHLPTEENGEVVQIVSSVGT